mmetsp:Transcript_19228/g.59304  ORF Transcript_19228/g.59304 Transcript_19228/m.59304 type:complete len:391 (-) Transcript_19228:3185-4357(-)
MLNTTICGSVAFKIKSPNFSTFRHAWNGNCSSEPLITMFGKSRPVLRQKSVQASTCNNYTTTIRSYDSSTLVRTMHFQRIQHPLSRHDDLLGLLLDGQRPNQRRHFFGRLPLGQLPESLLAGPDRRVNDLQEQLASPRIEDEDAAVYGLGRQVSFERLVDGDSIDVGVVDEPNDLVGEELAVVLRGQVRLGRFGRVQLEALSDAFSEDVEGRVGLDDLRHGLLHQRLAAPEPAAVAGVQVVRQVDGDQSPGRRRINGHVVRRVIEELGPGVALDVVRVEVAPPQLHVDPELARRRALEGVLGVVQQGRLRDLPLVRRKQQDVRARGVHLVTLARVDGLLLHVLDLEGVELLVEHLAVVGDHPAGEEEPLRFRVDFKPGKGSFGGPIDGET